MDTNKAVAWLADYAATISQHATELTDLDRQIGDADHGSNMERGMKAVAALEPAGFADAEAYLKKAAMTLVSTVGGASGPLYGTFLLRFAAAVPADDSPAAMAAAWRAGLDGVVARGKAGPGDKTLVDVLQPAVEAMEAGHASLPDCLAAGLAAARKGSEDAVPLVARKGRASYLGERSAGHADPGAASMTLLLECAARTLA